MGPHIAGSSIPRITISVYCLFAGFAVLVPTPATALTLHGMFGNNMVLQQGIPVPVWGWADPDASVTVSFGGQTKQTNADAGGRWRVALDPLTASATGRPLTVTTLQGNMSLSNVLVGEVWVCSGQSNMWWPLFYSDNGPTDTAAADYPAVRLLTVTHTSSALPQQDLVASWQVCSPASAQNFSAVAYYFGRELHRELDTPIGLISSSVGGTLAEQWMPGGDLYNGMIAPLTPYGIRGAIWYQGESNAYTAYAYATTFQELIRVWRMVWSQGDFPFYYVQIAPYDYNSGERAYGAILREAQLKSLATANTGMAVTMDIGNPTDIHPTNKRDVGGRLALWALAKNYGKNVTYSGPLYKAMAIESSQIRIAFDYTDGGLSSRDGLALTWFTIAGVERVFYPAEAVSDGKTLVVRSSQVPHPIAVRFGWSDVAEPNLMNGAGLPASPFRTDTWLTLMEQAVGLTKPLDSDGDGLADTQEASHSTNANNPDSDGDGLTDGDEVIVHGTDPTVMDSDTDGLTDTQEIITYNTSPTRADSDSDGMPDGEEVANGTDPNAFDALPAVGTPWLALLALGLVLSAILYARRSTRHSAK